jgi:hypothetical protein
MHFSSDESKLSARFAGSKLGCVAFGEEAKENLTTGSNGRERNTK